MNKNDYFRDTEKGWIMQQILLDNLALGEGISLRIIKLEELRDLYQHFCNAQDEKNNDTDDENSDFNFTESFPDKSAFDTFSKQVVDWFLTIDEHNPKIPPKFSGLKSLYKYFSNKIFPILPSNLHSLEFLSQTIVKYWRIYSLLWLYQKLGVDDAAVFDEEKSTPLEKVYGFNSCWARYQMVKMRDENDGDHNVLLLAGPVFEVNVNVLTNETNVDTEVTDKAERLLASMIKRTADSSHDSGSYFRQAIQLETVRQDKFLLKRFENVHRIWNLLYNASIVDDTKISHKYLRMLTVWAQHVDKISKENTDEDQHIDNVLLTSDGLYGKKLRNVQLSAMKKEGAWCIGMKALDANVAIESTLKKDEFQIDKPIDKFYDLYTRLERKTKQLDKNRLIVMDLWLESQFSAPLNSSDKESPDEDHVGYRLAAWVCAALRADVTTIHSYHPEEDEHPLKVQEIFIRDKKYQRLRAGTIDGMKSLPKEKRELSNVYGVLLTGRERICLDRELACNSKNDAHETLCKIEISLKDMHEEWSPGNAEMVVPIKFNGRVLGAIAVVSIAHWRFRWGQRMLLLNIATNLGAYWYQQRHLSCLNKIQMKVLDFNQQKCDQKNLYDEICKQAAVLFLCKGAGLWLRDNINDDLFIREGEHVVVIVDVKQSVKAGKTFISETVKEAESQNATKAAATAIRCKSVDKGGESVDKGGGISEENRKTLAELGIKYVAHLPIRDEKGKVIAILSLYDNSGREFDQSWHFIAQFFAGHLNVLIDSVAAVIRDRMGRKQLMLHQIWDSGSHLADKAEKIAAPICNRVDELNQIYTVLSTPAVAYRLKAAKMMGEIPKNRDICNDLEKIIRRLRDHSSQPLADVHDQASRLRNQLCVFSAGFKDKYEQALKSVYSKNPKCIPYLMEQVTAISINTADPEFVEYLISEQVLHPHLDSKPEPVNLRAEIVKVATSGGDYYTAQDFSSVKATILLGVNNGALTTVLTNLWRNALKYRINESDVILWSTEDTKHGGCKLQISNPSITYTEEELPQLKIKGYQHPQWKNIKQNQHADKGYNQGLGLYLVDSICRHVLHISFEVKQYVYADGRSDFICELIFNPDLTIKR